MMVFPLIAVHFALGLDHSLLYLFKKSVLDPVSIPTVVPQSLPQVSLSWVSTIEVLSEIILFLFCPPMGPQTL